MATIFVKKDGSGNATTIQEGIQVAQIGDIVEVEAGTFDENIDLWKGITLKGAGKDQTIITTTLRAAITSRSFVLTLNSPVITLTQAMIDSGATTSDYQVGRIVTATGIPANTRIISKTPTTLTLSANITTASTNRAVAMALQNDAGIRVRGTNGIVRDLKVIGFDHPTNPGVEYAALMFRPSGLGSAAAYGWEVFNCEVVANGEYAILAESNAAIGNLNIHDNIISGKTFVGDNPAVGNQFTVWNVPRQLVVLQGVNTGSNIFSNNTITGTTGGLTIDGVPSYNTAVTIDPVGAVVSGNTFNTVSGTGYALRVRGLSASTTENVTLGESAGYYILPNHSVGVLITVGTMIANSSKYWVCTQEHTSSATNAPLGVDGSQFWSEITLEQVNASGIYGVGLEEIGSNVGGGDPLVAFSQSASGESISISFAKNTLKAIPSVGSDPVFGVESNWNIVGLVYKKDSKRMTSGFKAPFDQTNSMKLKSALPGETFTFHKVIISKADRTLKVVNRSEIENASMFDITLK
jgi:hypothetical protein